VVLTAPRRPIVAGWRDVRNRVHNRGGTARRVENPWGAEIWWAATTSTWQILHVNRATGSRFQYLREEGRSSYVLRGPDPRAGRVLRNALTDEQSVSVMLAQPPGTIPTIEALEDSESWRRRTPTRRRRPHPRRLRPRGTSDI